MFGGEVNQSKCSYALEVSRTLQGVAGTLWWSRGNFSRALGIQVEIVLTIVHFLRYLYRQQLSSYSNQI